MKIKIYFIFLNLFLSRGKRHPEDGPLRLVEDDQHRVLHFLEHGEVKAPVADVAKGDDLQIVAALVLRGELVRVKDVRPQVVDSL